MKATSIKPWKQSSLKKAIKESNKENERCTTAAAASTDGVAVDTDSDLSTSPKSKTKTKKRKETEDTGPKPAQTAYFLFLGERRPILAVEQPDMPHKERMGACEWICWPWGAAHSMPMRILYRL